jgi:hypothetical protein
MPALARWFNSLTVLEADDVRVEFVTEPQGYLDREA